MEKDKRLENLKKVLESLEKDKMQIEEELAKRNKDYIRKILEADLATVNGEIEDKRRELSELEKNDSKQGEEKVTKPEPTKEQIELQNQISEVELDIAILYNAGYTDETREIQGKKAELLELYQKLNELEKGDSKQEDEEYEVETESVPEPKSEPTQKPEQKPTPEPVPEPEQKPESQPETAPEQDDNSYDAQISRLKEKIAKLESERPTTLEERNRNDRQIKLLEEQIKALAEKKAQEENKALRKTSRFGKIRNALKGILGLPGKALNAIKNRFSKPKEEHSIEVDEWIAKLDKAAQEKVNSNPFKVHESQLGKNVPQTNNNSKDNSKSKPIVGNDGRGGFGD